MNTLSLWSYTTDFREVNGKVKGECTFVVEVGPNITDATLRWHGNPDLFRNVRLLDEQSGETMKVRAGGSYNFSIDGERAFRLVVR